MPPRKSAGPQPSPVYLPDRLYAVTLAQSTTWKNKRLRRDQDLEMRGDVCEQLAAHIASAVLIGPEA